MKEHINLFQPDLLEGKVGTDPSPRRLLLPLSLLLFISLFAGLYAQEGKKRALLQKEVETIQRQRDQLRQQVAAFTSASLSAEEAGRIKENLMRDDPALKDRIIWSRILLEVSRIVPERVWITKFENDPAQGVRFEGFALSYQKVTDLILSLESSRHFEDILLDFSRQNSSERKVEFSIHARFKKGVFEERVEQG